MPTFHHDGSERDGLAANDEALIEQHLRVASRLNRLSDENVSPTAAIRTARLGSTADEADLVLGGGDLTTGLIAYNVFDTVLQDAGTLIEVAIGMAIGTVAWTATARINGVNVMGPTPIDATVSFPLTAHATGAVAVNVGDTLAIRLDPLGVVAATGVSAWVVIRQAPV